MQLAAIVVSLVISVIGFGLLGRTAVYIYQFVKLGQLIASSPGLFPRPLADACLRFLDEVNGAQMRDVDDMLSGIHAPSFDVELKGVGEFGHRAIFFSSQRAACCGLCLSSGRRRSASSPRLPCP